jgi:hypothetical protein
VTYPGGLNHEQQRYQDEDKGAAWRSAGPELGAAGIALVSCSIAAYVLAGLAGAVLVTVVFSALALVVLTFLLPQGSPPPPRPEMPDRLRPATTSLHSYWRLKVHLREATISAFTYQAGLGPRLEHLLAARLSQRHGINLYTDPEAARRVLCAKPKDQDLWAWVDPTRQASNSNDAAGIPPRALARLVRRLEQL